MAWTLADARIFMKDQNWDDTSTNGTRKADRIINDAAVAMRSTTKWDFDRRRGRVTLAAVYSTGTVSVTVGSTTVTGVGTTFTTADVGKFIRMNGEDVAYEVGAYVGAGEITLASAYQGAAALSAVTFELTQERIALPAAFRSFERPQISANNGQLLPLELQELLRQRMAGPVCSSPVSYAVEWVLAANAQNPGPYLWVYPSPDAKLVAEFTYWVWPYEASATTDGFGFPTDGRAQAAAARVHREFIRALLYQEQGKLSEYTTALQYAEQLARMTAGQFQSVQESAQCGMWSPDADGGGGVRVVTIQAEA